VLAVRDAYAADGLTVEVKKMGQTFARFLVTDEAGRTTKVEMGYDWRAEPPTVLGVGPVLHPDDAVANKVSTVFTRAEARDYVDVAAALTSGRYTGEQLLCLAEERDPGFDRGMFAQALRAAGRWDDEDYMAYRLDAPAVTALRASLRASLRAWADHIEHGSAEANSPAPAGSSQRTSSTGAADIRQSASRTTAPPPAPGDKSGHPRRR